MSRLFGDRSLTTRSPIRTSPALMSSRPATMRSAVVLPQPDGPTNTMNSPSSTRRSSPRTAGVPSGYTFVTSSRVTCATVAHLPRGRRRPYPGAIRDKRRDPRVPALLALEVGSALFREGLRPFLGVVGREDGLAVLELVRERFLLGHAVGLAQRAQDGLDRERTVVVDGLRDLERLRERLTVGHDVTDEPDARRFLGGGGFGGGGGLRFGGG